MKVKTFTGSETAKVDKRVNDWLAQSGINSSPHAHPADGFPPAETRRRGCSDQFSRRTRHISIY